MRTLHNLLFGAAVQSGAAAPLIRFAFFRAALVYAAFFPLDAPARPLRSLPVLTEQWRALWVARLEKMDRDFAPTRDNPDCPPAEKYYVSGRLYDEARHDFGLSPSYGPP
jgi:hypothetical protein